MIACMLNCSVMSKSLWPLNCSPLGSSVHGIFHVKMLEWVAIFLPQGVFPTQRSNRRFLCLMHCRRILYPLGHRESPKSQLIVFKWIFLSSNALRTSFSKYIALELIHSDFHEFTFLPMSLVGNNKSIFMFWNKFISLVFLSTSLGYYFMPVTKFKVFKGKICKVNSLGMKRSTLKFKEQCVSVNRIQNMSY